MKIINIFLKKNSIILRKNVNKYKFFTYYCNHMYK